MFKSMKLFHQVLAIVLITYIAASSLTFYFTQAYLHEYYRTLEDSLKQEVQSATERHLFSEQERLGTLTQAHAYWTDLISRSNAMDTTWIHENATAYLKENTTYRVGEVYLKNYLNSYSDQIGELPRSVYLKIESQVNIEDLTDRYSSYLVTYNTDSYILTAAALAESDSKNPSGIFILGYKIDKDTESLVNEIFSSRADVAVALFPGGGNRIISMDNESFMGLIRDNMTVSVIDIRLVDNISNRLEKLLLFVFLISIPAVLFILVFLNKISANVRRSVEIIKKLSYHDYSKKITLDSSVELYELSQCINNLSEGLRERDREIERKYLEIISILVKTLEEVDVYTKGHSERVSHYSTDLAGAIGYPDLESIRISGLLHDIGKVTIDSVILNKPGMLTAAEFAVIKRHPEIACNILELSDVFQFSKDIVRYHHEKFDGSGYPSGLTGENIPLGARIVAIADVFDALTSARSYRDPMDPEEALAIIIDGAGSHFDQELVDVFGKIALASYDMWFSMNPSLQIDEVIEVDADAI